MSRLWHADAMSRKPMKAPSLRSAGGRAGSGVLSVVSKRGIWCREWSAAADMASAKADVWRRTGLPEGAVMAFVAETTPSVILGIVAAWMSGATVLPLSPSMPSETRRRICHTAGVHRLCYAGDGDALSATHEQGWPEVERLDLDDWPTHRLAGSSFVDTERLAVLQPTSGSTADSRLVRVSAVNIESNLAAIRQRLNFTVEDSLLAWLPLFHDMGLVGFLAQGWSTFVDTTLIDPVMFLTQPGSWLNGVAQSGATITAAPNFAYGLATRVLDASSGSLAHLRAALCGAEQVQLHTMERFLDAAAPLQFSETALMPVYGLGEATLAVTIPDTPRSLISSDSPDGVSRATLGTALDETQIRISYSSDNLDHYSGIGHVQVKGPHVADGYLTGSGNDRKHIVDGWLETGDRGAITSENELIICGRYKELMILGGRNVAPEPVEEAVCALQNIRAGAVVAFSVPFNDTERLVVLFESKEDSPTLHRQVRNAVLEATGETPTTVACSPRSIPRTTSGKLKRVEARQKYIDRQAI